MGAVRQAGECAVDGCDNPAHARGWCQGHYRRWLRNGDLGTVPVRRSRWRNEPPPACAVDGCDNPAHARGWCQGHYSRWHRSGNPTSPETTALPAAGTASELPQVEVADTAWMEQGACRGKPTALWFPDDHEDPRGHRARAVCATCPVRLTCASWAVRAGETWGVWGGMTPAQLQRLHWQFEMTGTMKEKAA